RTDFETETLLNFAWAGREPNASLVRAYVRLLELQSACPEFSAGEVYFHRNNAAGGDFDDRILAYVRYGADGAFELCLMPLKTLVWRLG
ncbi:MAG: hypothetical protein OSB73_12985, partial [Candidatus Latescibacteria bacterium]|nr:hypothetical protein [Candidatus Latescibacterota bacterium]